jgi:hypothetical protein
MEATKDVKATGVKRSISTVTALIIAIISLLLSPVPIVNNFAFVLAVIALIFGFIGLRATKKGKKKGRKMAIISLILAVLACAIVLASQKFYGDSLDKAGKDIQTSVNNSSGKNTSNLLGKAVTVDIGAFQVTPDQYTTSTSLPVKVTNKENSSKSYSIQIEAVDSSGTRIDDDTVNVNNLGANQSQDFKAFEFVQSDKVDALKTSTFKVASVSQY